ncbi:MAG: hypothetical protein J1F01_08265 [Oscillospiraceae bacterium]|nr:hypothetical protein [Oscillospiraceae bacterium]
MVSLGFDIEEPSEIIKDVKAKLQPAVRDKVDKLAFGDLKIAANIEASDNALLSWKEFIGKIKEATKGAAFYAAPLTNKGVINR